MEEKSVFKNFSYHPIVNETEWQTSLIDHMIKWEKIHDSTKLKFILLFEGNISLATIIKEFIDNSTEEEANITSLNCDSFLEQVHLYDDDHFLIIQDSQPTSIDEYNMKILDEMIRSNVVRPWTKEVGQNWNGVVMFIVRYENRNEQLLINFLNTYKNDITVIYALDEPTDLRNISLEYKMERAAKKRKML